MSRAMKPSGIEWIGDIPEGWKVRRLRYLCKILTGNKDTVDRELYGQYPFYVRSPIVERINSFSFDGEAILMAGDGVGAGRVFHYVNGKFDYHQRVYNLHKFNSINAKYLFYYLQENFKKEIEQSNAKSTVDSIRLPMLLDFPISICGLPAQEKIVEYLDRKCELIESTIEKQKTVIEKLKLYKQSVITEAVTKGLDPTVPMKPSGIEWIGEIPEGWEIGRVKNIAMLNPSNYKSFEEGTIISFSPMDFIGQGKMVSCAIEIEKVKNGYTFFANDDVIMAKVTPCFENGNIAIANNLLNGIGYGSSELYVFRCKNVSNTFLFYFLQNNIFKNKCISSMYGAGGLKRVPADFINSYKLALPPLPEQQAIADYLDQKCSQIDQSIELKQKLIEKLSNYKKSLIYECVTGKREVGAS